MTSEEVKQLKPEENEVAMEELEKNARELILDITKKTLKTLEYNGLLKEPSSLQNLSFSSQEMRAFLEKIKAPKYDPCRKFRKGDKVRVVENKGRKQECSGSLATVKNDEDKNRVLITIACGGIWWVDAVYLELVTPVEELAPYTLEEETAYIDDEECGMLHIYYNYNGGRDKVRTFYENGPESWNATKAAAEAECKRLNAEHRKDANNGGIL